MSAQFLNQQILELREQRAALMEKLDEYIAKYNEARAENERLKPKYEALAKIFTNGCQKDDTVCPIVVERDEARAENERMRAVVEVAKNLVRWAKDAHHPLEYGPLANAVKALDAGKETR